MNPEDVKAALKDLQGMTGDDEAAHSYEDGLYGSILLAIAEGKCENPVECCRLALTSRDINFARWCA